MTYNYDFAALELLLIDQIDFNLSLLLEKYKNFEKPDGALRFECQRENFIYIRYDPFVKASTRVRKKLNICRYYKIDSK